MTTQTTSLFEKLGGRDAVSLVVDRFYEKVLRDPRLVPFFSDTDMEKQRRHQKAFFTMVLGGPEQYKGKGMRDAHEGRGIGDEEFGAVAQHLQATLEEVGVSPEDVATVMAAAASLHDDVVGA